VENQRNNPIKQSLNDSVKSLGAVIKSLYEMAPALVVVAALLAFAVISVTLLWTPLMIGTASLLVVLVSLCIFAVRGNFGEALLSLVGGLLTVFAFEWTPARYIAFSTAWVGFALAAILIASVKLAAQVEDIYRQASLHLSEAVEGHTALEKQLREIGASKSLKMLGPIERAEVIRVLAFRRMPVDLIEPCLHAVETLSVITKCDIKSIAIFLADFFLSFSPDNTGEAQRFVDILYGVVKDAPVSPEDFFTAFAGSRRLLLSDKIQPIVFLEGLRDCLAAGIAPSDVCDELRSRLGE